ncbi:hypothetical protein J6590_058438 [Homalodisca vitripennis]|nr:hypothetical protein J6590_058438 [Homalodisca vitripennis]
MSQGCTNADDTENAEVAMENEDLVTSDPVHATETVENINDCGNYEEHGQGEEDDLGGTGPLTSPAQFERKSGRNLRKKGEKHELIVDLLQHRKEERNKLVKCMEKMIDMEEKYSKENDLFFKSMAAIVNKLDNKSQAIARSQVFRVGEKVTHRVPKSTNWKGYRVSLVEELEEIEPFQKNEFDLERSAQIVEQPIPL